MSPLVVLLSACTPPSATGSDAPVVAPLVALDDAETGEAPRAGNAIEPATALAVDLPEGLDGFVELRGYQVHDDGVRWTGLPIATLPITADTVSVVLPTAPEASPEPWIPTSYAVALRAADAGGEPGVYLGIADVHLEYVVRGADNGEWKLVRGGGRAHGAWLPWGSGVTLDANLVADDVLELAGGTTLPLTPDTRLFVATNPGGAPLADRPVQPGWALSLAGTPAVETGSLGGALFSIYTYEDANHDELRTGEPVTGEACIGGAPARMAWFPYPTELEDALAMVDRGVRAGWELVAVAPDGVRPTQPDERIGLVLAIGCEE